jgi:Methyltransferase domain
MQSGEARQLAKESRGIHGWFEAHGLFALIDTVQRAAGVRGDLFEIGTHHGKSAVMLARMVAETEAVGVCDIFGAQDRNASGSGSGDRMTFERNMERFAPRSELRVHACLSSELTAEQVGACRFFHIDGGHLAEEARGDLQLGAEVTVDRGAIIIDDPYRIEWPGVTDAIVAFLTEHDDWAPVALGFNKLLLCRRPSLGLYTGPIESDEAWSYIDRRVFDRKRLPLVGTEATIFYIPSYRQIPSLVLNVARARSLYGSLRARLGR